MENYYFFTVFIAICTLVNKRLANVLLVLGFIFFLFYLPSIEYLSYDYTVYRDTYEFAYFINDFPWIATGKEIDAEQLYISYSGIVYLLTGLEYPFFLALNFLISVGVSYFILKGFKKHTKSFFLLMIMPVILPTLFYFLIRSSLSMFLVVLGIFTLLNNTKKSTFWAVLFIYIGINLHSQYILIGVLSLIAYWIMNFKNPKRFKFNLNFIIVSSIGLVGFLLLAKNAIGVLSDILSLLPASDLASSKAGYLGAEDNRGFRITAILSVFVYPFMMINVLNKLYFTETTYVLHTKLKERTFLLLFTAIIFYGAAINIAFIDSSHLAGRLGKISDYLGMLILIPLYFRVCVGYKLEYVVLFLFVFVAPLIYDAIYEQVEWNIF